MVVIILVVPFAINAVAETAGIEASDLVGTANDNSSAFPNDNLIVSILYHFTDPGNLQEAKSLNGLIIAWTCALLGIFLFAGLMVSTIVNIMDRRTDQWRKGLVRYNNRFFTDYVVIVGGNEQVVSVIKASLKKEGCDMSWS